MLDFSPNPMTICNVLFFLDCVWFPYFIEARRKVDVLLELGFKFFDDTVDCGVGEAVAGDSGDHF